MLIFYTNFKFNIGASAYAGASRVTDTCYWMQYYYIEGENQKMMDLYPQLVEHVVEFRVYHRQVVAKYKGENYVPEPEHETIDIANGYRLIKEGEMKYKCEKLPDHEDTEKDEIEQLDQDSVQPPEPEPVQQNEKEYILSQKLAGNHIESTNQQSNNQIPEPASKPKTIDEKDLKGSKSKVTRYTEGLAKDDFDDDLHINLEIEKRNEQSDSVSMHRKPNEPKFEEIKIENEYKEVKEHSSASKMKKGTHQGSHPVLTIEGKESEKTGGMCGCSNCVIF